MRRPSIKFTTLAIFGSLAIVFTVLSVTALYGVREMNAATSQLAGRWLPGLSAVHDLLSAFKDERLAIAKHMLSTSDEGMQREEEARDNADKTEEGQIAEIRTLPLSAEEDKALGEFVLLSEKYDVLWQKLRVLSRENQNDAALRLFEAELSPVGDKMGALLEVIAKANNMGAARSKADSDAMYAKALILVLASVAIGAVTIVVGVISMLLTVTGPLGRITASMKTLAGGDTEKPIPFGGRGDEVGAMAAAVEVFRRGAISNRVLEAEAEQARRQSDLDRVAAQDRAEADAAERLRVATSGLAAGLKRLASGDLDFQIEEAFSPDFEALRHDFNASVSQLGETLSTISESIASIEGGSAEISAGADNLSTRTERQAASLEETAAALDQITANVKSSTQRTADARQVAVQARQAAVQSTDIVGKAEAAMQRIENSSQQISNIIGVIDEIAFQTNLLALNAGVEAARAGEAGKGFAVVAQEVRELAQRAAAAAKEIKSLIQTSSAEVVGGVKLVRDASGALKSIGDFITEINDHMQAIASSAQEQSTGLAEVNTAVNSMDQTTQQNAAMVEESTAASSSLSTDARRLRGLIGRFRLANVATTSVAALRNTAAAMGKPDARPGDFARPARTAPPPVSRIGLARAAGLETGQANWQEF